VGLGRIATIRLVAIERARLTVWPFPKSKTCGCAAGSSLRWECGIAMPNGQSAFALSDEEFPMTMQVGLVGTDGVLIASDTKWMYEPGYIDPSEDQELPRDTFNPRKIFIHHARGIAVSCARKMSTAQYIADKIIYKLKNENCDYPCESIKKIGASVLRSKQLPKDAQCLIVFALPVPRLYFFGFGPVRGKWGPICQKMDSTITAGRQHKSCNLLETTILPTTAD
jgi:hypothetical protein